MNKRTKTAKQMERHLKGLGNHYRIDILLHVSGKPGLTIDQLAEGVDGNYKTISQHVRYLVHAGLLEVSHESTFAHIKLSPYGGACVEFLKKFQSL
ncbi:MAG TPA: winged helix-turn-helix domain-containing protein [Candidatus Paceibacterota bacterium]|nr:winged helix-turn-helix domain-containing protein [Candidatus Paceibacterota bacterium]